MEQDARPTIWEQAQAKGVTRREFLGACTWMTALLGLPASAVSQIAKALETKSHDHFDEKNHITAV